MLLVTIQPNDLLLSATLHFYGPAAEEALARALAEEVETLWNEPRVSLPLEGRSLLVRFRIEARFRPELPEIEVLSNTDPRNNYFCIAGAAPGNISSVDGIPSNTGLWLRENLYTGSTTAAHEFGHTIGLAHPQDMDLRGRGRPGIMYPRGTLVDPPFQYDPQAPAGGPGGTMHPMHRRVQPEDIYGLRLRRLSFSGGRAVLGEFSSVYHWTE